MTPRLKLFLRVAGFLVLIAGAIWVSGYVRGAFMVELMPHNEAAVAKMVLFSLLTFTLLMATPFLPGAEIGMALLTAFGAAIAPAVYLATLTGLGIAFFVGRSFPIAKTARAVEVIGLAKGAARLRALEAVPRDQVISLVLQSTEPGLARWVLRHRYLGLILLINLPGNLLIGGGGGIALVAGLSRLFHPVWFFVAIAVGVLPVPLSFLIWAAP